MVRLNKFAGRLFAAALLSGAVWTDGQAAQAQTCGSDYTFKEGESLIDVAARVYGSPSQWSLIFYANYNRIGANAFMLAPGFRLRIPCAAGETSLLRPACRWRCF